MVGQAYRQSGSAFKPITYATGFELGTVTPATMLMDVKGIIAEGYSVLTIAAASAGEPTRTHSSTAAMVEPNGAMRLDGARRCRRNMRSPKIQILAGELGGVI